jgi:hypothetical protein
MALIEYPGRGSTSISIDSTPSETIRRAGWPHVRAMNAIFGSALTEARMKTFYQYQEASAKALVQTLVGQDAGSPEGFERELFFRIMDKVSGSTQPTAVANLLMDAHARIQEAWARIDPQIASALAKDVKGSA